MAIPFEREYLHNEYTMKERSCEDIAAEWKTYPGKIRRALIKFGIVIRNRSVAGILSAKHGRKKEKLPSRSEETKKKISEGVIKDWEKKKVSGSPEVARRKELGAKIIKLNTRPSKKRMAKVAAEQTELTKKRGSLVVNFILDELNKDERKFSKTEGPSVNIVSDDGKALIVIAGYYRVKTPLPDLRSLEFDKIILVRNFDQFFKVSSSRILLDKIRYALYTSEERIVSFDHPEQENEVG